MIKIGAGTLAGRILQQPKTSKTRPMTQRVRASIFNRLGDISGLKVLDAYAGSGAFGIEALSLGVSEVTFIEYSRSVAQVIQQNLEMLDLVSHTTIYIEPVQRAVKRLEGQSFDIILADPPYKELQEGDVNLLFSFLVKDGIGILSHSSCIASPELQNANLIDSRTYGDTTISYYRGKIGRS